VFQGRCVWDPTLISPFQLNRYLEKANSLGIRLTSFRPAVNELGVLQQKQSKENEQFFIREEELLGLLMLQNYNVQATLDQLR